MPFALNSVFAVAVNIVLSVVMIVLLVPSGKKPGLRDERGAVRGDGPGLRDCCSWRWWIIRRGSDLALPVRASFDARCAVFCKAVPRP